MKALQKNAPFGENTVGIKKSFKIHKDRIKNIRKCIDNETPRSFVGQSGPRSPNRRVVAKQMAEENLRRENFMLARRIFKIMQGESEITQSINHNEHLENHPGTMNFKQRLEEAQRIHHKNLMFAIRMQSIQPYYHRTDLSVTRPTRQRGDSPGSKHKKTKFMKEFEYTLQLAEEQSNSLDNDNNGGLGVYQGFMVDEHNSQSTSKHPDGASHGYHNQRPRTILLQYTKAQDNRILDVVVLKEPFRDRYAIFGLDVDDGQRYELRLTSEDVSNILDGDILVTSVDNVEVWMALLNKVRLKPVSTFNQLPFSHQEIDLLSANGLAFDFPLPYLPSSSAQPDAANTTVATKSMTSTPLDDADHPGHIHDNNNMGDRLPSAAGATGHPHHHHGNNQRPQSRAAPASHSRANTAGSFGMMPAVDGEFEALPFEYGVGVDGELQGDDVPLSSRTEASAGNNSNSRPTTSSRHPRTHSANNNNNSSITKHSNQEVNEYDMNDFLESDAETAEMVRASNAAAALAMPKNTATAAVAPSHTNPPALTPKQPNSRPSSKPASVRATSARTTTANTTIAGTGGAVTTTAAAAAVSSTTTTPANGAMRPAPPTKPKTPNTTTAAAAAAAIAPNNTAANTAGKATTAVSRPTNSSRGATNGRPQSVGKPAVTATAPATTTTANKANTSNAASKRPEEKALLAQEVTVQMTEEKLIASSKRLPEGLEELFVTPAHRVATEEFVGIVHDVTADAMIQAVHSVSDNLTMASVSVQGGSVDAASQASQVPNKVAAAATNSTNKDNSSASDNVADKETKPTSPVIASIAAATDTAVAKDNASVNSKASTSTTPAATTTANTAAPSSTTAKPASAHNTKKPTTPASTTTTAAKPTTSASPAAATKPANTTTTSTSSQNNKSVATTPATTTTATTSKPAPAATANAVAPSVAVTASAPAPAPTAAGASSATTANPADTTTTAPAHQALEIEESGNEEANGDVSYEDESFVTLDQSSATVASSAMMSPQKAQQLEKKKNVLKDDDIAEEIPDEVAG